MGPRNPVAGRGVGEEQRQALYGRVRFRLDGGFMFMPSRAMMPGWSLVSRRPAAISTGRAGSVTHRETNF